MKTHLGSCHCGAVQFEVQLQLDGKASRCNCTMCTKLGASGAIAKPEHFKLLKGESSLSTYAKHPEIAQRYFCSKCGIHCFSKGNLPELGGAFVGVHVNALDDVDLGEFSFVYWDGRHDNWQAGLRATPWPINARAA